MYLTTHLTMVLMTHKHACLCNTCAMGVFRHINGYGVVNVCAAIDSITLAEIIEITLFLLFLNIS